jgi:hypothetical protein
MAEFMGQDCFQIVGTSCIRVWNDRVRRVPLVIEVEEDLSAYQ